MSTSEVGYLVSLNVCGRPEALYSFGSYFCFAFSYMMFAKQELPVQVAGLNGVHVNLHMPAASRFMQHV